MTALPSDHRRRELARIHIARKNLGMAEDTYRDLLWTLGRVRSAADLDHAGRARVIEHLESLAKLHGLGERRDDPAWRWVNRAPADRRPMLAKIKKLLDAGARPKAYADAVSQRMHGVSLVEFCAPDQLHAVVAALETDRRRHTRREPN